MTMAINTPPVDTAAESRAVTRQAQIASRVRVWLLVILSFTVLVAYLDRVNVSVLIAFPRFLQEMGLKNNPVGQGLLMTFFLVAYGLGIFCLVRLATAWARERQCVWRWSPGRCRFSQPQWRGR